MVPWGDRWRELGKAVQVRRKLDNPLLTDNQSWLHRTKLGVEGIKEYLKQDRKDDANQNQKEEEEDAGAVSMCDRLMLVSSLFSIETCMSFQQLYQILFLQFLGVPLALVSVDGILAGFAGMVILPLIGSWADGGDNSKRRKMIAMFGSLVVFVSGLVLLITASCVKIQRLGSVLVDIRTHPRNFSFLLTNDTVDGPHGKIFSYYGWNNQTSIPQTHDVKTIASERSGQEDNGCVGIIILSILGFMCIDMGFDLTIAISRASILDVVPKFQHKQVLVLATIVQSVAGFICATVGCFDLPRVLGSVFNTDGTAATLIFFCCVLMTTSLVSFSLMGLANYRLSRSKKSSRCRSDSASNSSESTETTRRESIVQAAFDQLEERGSLSIHGSATRFKHLEDNQVFATSTIPTGAADAYTRPLLLDSLKTNYLTINTDGSFPSCLCDVDPLHQSSFTNSIDVKHPEVKITPEKYEDGVSTSTSDATVNGASVSHFAKVEEEETADDEGVSTVLEAINQPYSMAMTPLEALNVLEIEHIREDEDFIKPESGEWQERYRKMKKKLLILCVSCFFTLGASMSFSIYAFNSFNRGIMHGDPSALPMSEGRQRYEDGLRLGSFGNMVFYSAFLLISLTNTNIIRMIGEKGQFIMNHVILVVGLLAVLTTKRQWVFMMFMGCCGLFRPCMLTLPFVMAHQFVQEGMRTEDEESGQKKSHTGRVMTLIGLLVPAHFCILSIMMGPLMEATGNPWVPLFYCLGTSSVSLCVFSLLFFV